MIDAAGHHINILFILSKTKSKEKCDGCCWASYKYFGYTK